MIRHLTLVALFAGATALAGCGVPATSPEINAIETSAPAAGTAPSLADTAQTPDAAACRARGGELRPMGRMQSLQCVIPFADAGRRCTDGDQCEGECLAEGGVSEKPDQASGVCQANNSRFGCTTTIEDGRAGPTLCVD